MSSSEFLHPIITPGELVRGVSDGQKILSNSLPPTIISCRRPARRTLGVATAPARISLLHPNADATHSRQVTKFTNVDAQRYQSRFPHRDSLNRKDEEEEEQREDGKSLCGTALQLM